MGCVCGQIILAHCESVPLSEFYSLTESFLHAQGTAPSSAFTVDSIWCHSKPPDRLPRNRCCVGWLPPQHFHPLTTHWLFVVAFWDLMGVFLSNNSVKSVVLVSPLPFVSPSPTYLPLLLYPFTCLIPKTRLSFLHCALLARWWESLHH